MRARIAILELHREDLIFYNETAREPEQDKRVRAVVIANMKAQIDALRAEYSEHIRQYNEEVHRKKQTHEMIIKWLEESVPYVLAGKIKFMGSRRS